MLNELKKQTAMKRRDSERVHAYANEAFSYLNIFDIQGVLKEQDTYKCGVEAYQVTDFSLTNFDLLNQKEEIAKYHFCAQLGVPYYIIITSEANGRYQIYNSHLTNGLISFSILGDYSKYEFLHWWREKQSFNQQKPMYNASERIAKSIIDNDLFENSLAWGVNIDGFSIDDDTHKVLAIFEKRICTFKPPYTVDNYDPNRFFSWLG